LSVRDATRVELFQADVAQEAMKLIQRQHGRSRVIDRRGQGARGDVHHDAKRKAGILFHRPLRPKGNHVVQRRLIDVPVC
jgi:hypothetical protein